MKSKRSSDVLVTMPCIKRFFISGFLISFGFCLVCFCGESFAEKIDLSKPLTVSQTISLCYKEACPQSPVIIKGILRGTSDPVEWFRLSDKDEPVSLGSVIKDHYSESIPNYISLRLDVSLFDKIIFLEKNHLLRGGSVEVEVKVLLPKVNKSDNQLIVGIKPQDVRLIGDFRCSEGNEARATLDSPENDCFDFSGYNILPSEAYKKIMNSK